MVSVKTNRWKWIEETDPEFSAPIFNIFSKRLNSIQKEKKKKTELLEKIEEKFTFKINNKQWLRSKMGAVQ